MYTKFILFAALATQAVADLACKPYVPKNWTSNAGKVLVYNEGSFNRPALLPTYAGVGNPWQLRSKSSPGAKFTLNTCTSKSLGLAPSTQSSCSHGGCYISYQDYIQVINPYTGHCLTTANFNKNNSNINFAPCSAAPTNTAQLWSANEYVDYSPNYANITGYEPVTFSPIEPAGEEPNPPFKAWYISEQDNKSLQVILYQYTQDGVYMNLEQFS